MFHAGQQSLIDISNVTINVACFNPNLAGNITVFEALSTIEESLGIIILNLSKIEMKSLRIPLPEEFDFELALAFLQRSPRELLHKVLDGRIEKALLVKDVVIVFSIRLDKTELLVEFLNTNVTVVQATEVVKYIREWLDLDTDLKPFYAMCEKDKLMKALVKN